MPSTRWSSVMLAVGVGLLTAAFFGPQAEAGPSARGGTLRYDTRLDFSTIDPALNYNGLGWQLEHVTCDRLLGIPDEEATARPVPQIAAAMPTLSKDGTTYTFTVRRNYRFSTGERVTAHSFVYAWNRAMSPKMTSPAQVFMEIIAGAPDVIAGRAQAAQGLRAMSDWKLEVRLTKVAPDFLARMTMPFFCPLPVGTPLLPEGIDAPIPGSGPYYIKEWVKRRVLTAVRNPYYTGPRQANVDQIVYTIGGAQEATRLRIEKGEADVGGPGPEAWSELVRTHGLNKGRVFIRKNLSFWHFAFNHDRPLFRDNPRLTRALNHTIDRPMLVRQFGYLAGARTDQILPHAMPGFQDWNVYSLKSADPERARRELRPGDLRGAKAVLYTGNFGGPTLVAQVLQYNAKQIGLDVEIRTWDFATHIAKIGTKGEPFDIGVYGWAADYPDPSNFINVLFLGDNIRADHNQNTSYFNDQEFNRRMRQAALLGSEDRYTAFGLLDRDLMRGPAPSAPFMVSNARTFVSARVKNLTFSPLAGLLLNKLTVQ